MNRGEIWTAQVGRKSRPVLVLTRSEVIDVRELITVAEVTTTIRGIAAETPIPDECGLGEASVVNCDGLHTVPRSSLTKHVSDLDEETMHDVGWATSYAIGCSDLT